MNADDLFLASDAALRDVIDRLTPEHLAQRAPQEWTGQTTDPTIRDIVAAHAYDEAWVPDVLAGRGVADGDPWKGRDLLGDDPIAAYDAFNDLATAAVRERYDPEAVLRFQYGDYPASEGLLHLATYRAFQSWLIAKHVGLPFRLPDSVVEGMTELVLPEAEMWRQWGVFPPAIEPPADADAETRLLCAVGYWHP